MRFRKDERSGWLSLAAATGAAMAVGALCVPLLRALNHRIRTPIAAGLAPDARSVAEVPSVSERPDEHRRAKTQVRKRRPRDPRKKHGPKKHEKDQPKKSRKPGPKKRQPRD